MIHISFCIDIETSDELAVTHVRQKRKCLIFIKDLLYSILSVLLESTIYPMQKIGTFQLYIQCSSRILNLPFSKVPEVRKNKRKTQLTG
jgi:hypothetical protein